MRNTLEIERLRFSAESQTLDRKNARIDPKALAIHIVAFANADGGDVAIGIEDNGDITGINNHEANINELLRVPFAVSPPFL